MAEDIVIRLESEEPDDDSAQFNIMNILSEKIGILESEVEHIKNSIGVLAKVDVAIAESVQDVKEEVEEVKEEIIHVEEMGQAMAEEIKNETEEIEAVSEPEPDLPTADEEIAKEADVPAPEPEPEVKSDSAPGKEHWFFRKRGR
jgi:hypothetical protein